MAVASSKYCFSLYLCIRCLICLSERQQLSLRLDFICKGESVWDMSRILRSEVASFLLFLKTASLATDFEIGPFRVVS
jgi:hypothetical protein